MTLVKIYLDGTKFFELDSIERLFIKDKLPLSKINQIYFFHIYYQSRRGYYQILSDFKYFIYKDPDGERYLYQHKNNSIAKIDDLSFSHYPTIKIFMRTTFDYFIYHISINQKDQYILSEYSLSKKKIIDIIFRHHIVDVISVDVEEYGKIIRLDMNVNYLFKKNTIYHLKNYIYKKLSSPIPFIYT
jgi:hypothetical protein